MNRIENIQDQLERAYRADAWHGPALREILDGISADQARDKPVPQTHSIWELVAHITVWISAVRRRLDGDPAQLTDAENFPVAGSGEAAWQQALEALDAEHVRLRQRVSSLSEAELDTMVPQQKYTAYFMLQGLVQHNLYHAGQIALLKKAS